MTQNITDPPVENPMAYVPPTPTMTQQHHRVEIAITDAYHVLLEACPRSAERTLAIRKLQEARMWANAAIAFDGRTYKT